MAENRATILVIEHSSDSEGRRCKNCKQSVSLTTVSRVINTHYKRHITECDDEFITELSDQIQLVSRKTSGYPSPTLNRTYRFGDASLKWVNTGTYCPEQYHACIFVNDRLVTEVILSYASDMWEC